MKEGRGVEAQNPALEPWLVSLRARLLSVALRRVPREAAEDLVQDALRVILERGIRVGRFESVDGLPPLVWCLQVLRNIIGNYYQRSRIVTKHAETGPVGEFQAADGLTPLDALESEQAVAIIRAAIASMDDGEGNCGRYLAWLANAGAASDLARQEGLEPMVLFRRVYRCRIKLRAVLMRKGILA